MKNVMLDLETMGKRAGCAIVSIGACRFNPESGNVGVTFYRNVELQSCIDAGLHINADTVYWWLGQSEEARLSLMRGERLSLFQALSDFKTFFNEVPDSIVWGHGSSFDIPIMEAAYSALESDFATGHTYPWTYKNIRDVRTVLSLGKTKVAKHAGAHNAVEDAVAQARAVAKAMSRIRPEGEDE